MCVFYVIRASLFVLGLVVLCLVYFLFVVVMLLVSGVDVHARSRRSV